jgi:8-hydroxy-5-deazaflavin:NADPH oxidoreductase
MTTAGFIGSGMIGSTVAKLAVAAGHRVILSNSRGPQTLGDLAAELGPLARAGTTAEAAAGDLVVVAIPVKAYQDIPAAPLAGRVVLDTGNYSPARRDGQIAELDDGTLTSSELLQRLLPGAAVVKVFNNIFFKHLEHLSRPAGAPDRTFLPIAGDDPQAKKAVTAFLDEIGYGAVDAGSLAGSWRQEPGTPVYGGPYGPFGNEKGTPAGASVIRDALAAATGRLSAGGSQTVRGPAPATASSRPPRTAGSARQAPRRKGQAATRARSPARAGPARGHRQAP